MLPPVTLDIGFAQGGWRDFPPPAKTKSKFLPSPRTPLLVNCLAEQGGEQALTVLETHARGTREYRPSSSVFISRLLAIVRYQTHVDQGSPAIADKEFHYRL